jgi:hypothetical protein
VVSVPIGLYALWAMSLLLQNASFTFVSRARNSGSYLLHAIASLCSNGTWFMQNMVGFGLFMDAILHGSMWQRIGLGTFYTACTVSGSLLMHYVQRNYIEPRVRHGKVGA